MRVAFGLASLLQCGTAITPAEEAGLIAGGLVEGFVGAADIKVCMQKSVTTIEDVKDAVQDFEKKDAYDVLKGLKALAGGLHTLPDALRACKAAESDIEQLVDALKQFSTPKSFAFHVAKDLVVNGRDIFSEIYQAVGDYKAGKFEDFGVSIGTALHKLIIGTKAQFDEFMQVFGKQYSSDEERARRFEIFKDNLLAIENMRALEQGSATYSHLTPFADVPLEEFSLRHGFRLGAQNMLLPPAAELQNTSGLPDDFDWIAKGAVNPVKNQQQCGSCWTFATVANIEGAGFVANQKLLSLSEQELVDCDKGQDHGCQGGLPSNAYKFLISSKTGLELESDYPYTAKDGTCSAVAAKEQVFVGGWKQISTDEDQIAAALMQYGPLAIGINAGPMQMYHGGVAHPWKMFCNPKSLDHGVAIVSFGVDSGSKYWRIRNSWGPSWGEKGYYRIIRGTGACGLNTMVTTATDITFKSANSVIV